MTSLAPDFNNIALNSIDSAISWIFAPSTVATFEEAVLNGTPLMTLDGQVQPPHLLAQRLKELSEPLIDEGFESTNLIINFINKVLRPMECHPLAIQFLHLLFL